MARAADGASAAVPPTPGANGTAARTRARVPADELVRAFRDRDESAVQTFLAGCPPRPERDVAAQRLRELADPATRMLALDALALAYARSPHADIGLEISRATERLARAAFDTAPSAELLSVAAWSAEIASTSLVTLGRADEMITTAEASLAWLTRHGSIERNCVLHLWIAEALFEQGRFAEAERHLLAAERTPWDTAEQAVRERRDRLRRNVRSYGAPRPRARDPRRRRRR